MARAGGHRFSRRRFLRGSATVAGVSWAGPYLCLGATGAGTPGELRASIERSRGGIEVSGEVLWATLLVLIAEMLLSARLTRRRSDAAGAGPNREGAI